MSAALLLAPVLLVAGGAPPGASGPEAGEPVAVFADWAGAPDRVWAGPNLWANRLQDWRVRGGKLECVEGAANKPLRTVVHTGVRLGGPGTFEASGAFEASVTVEPAAGGDPDPDSAAGLLVGAGPNIEPRAAALVHHSTGPGAGYFCGVTADGRLFVRDLADPQADPTYGRKTLTGDGPVRLTVVLKGDGRLNVGGTRGGSSAFFSTNPLPADRLRGSLGLVSHPGDPQREKLKTGRWAFSKWRLAGPALGATPADCELGPILGTKYTIDAGSSDGGGDGTGLLTLQAQFWPLQWEAGDAEGYEMTARLEVDRGDGFEPAATAPITRPDWTAVFALEDFDLSEDVPYRVVYDLNSVKKTVIQRYAGVIRGEPADGTVTLGALSCNNNNRGGVDRSPYSFTNDFLWFPHTPIRDAVLKADPDVCYFAGDQIYEGSSPTRADTSGKDPDSYLDYLYKWNLWVWAYRDVTRDRPCAVVPDDHDVFQPNLWGESGKKAPRVVGVEGGYFLPPAWVNMVQKTQTGNLPPAHRAAIPGTAVEAYYTEMTYGGVSFAVLEDRKFKTGPAGRVPETVSGRADHIVEEDYDKSQFDSPEWQLLGPEQEAFVDRWAADWSGGVWFKCVLSQSPFAGAATHHGPNRQYLVADLDANGWPKHARDAAVSAARRGLAAMVHGDQHLSTLLQHGVEAPGDAGWSFAVPGTANIYPRWWDPKQVGGDGTTTPDEPGGEPTYTGDFQDGFGNHVTVFAAANPGESGREPAILHDRRPGWGTIVFKKDGPDGEPTVTFNNWPRGVDPTAENARQYRGWPRSATRSQMDGREPVAHLPAVTFETPGEAVVTVVRTDVDPPETLYTLRPTGPTFRPPVFAADGEYRVTIAGPRGEPTVREGVTPE